jgi:RNA recognition motif-containing protein
MIISVGNLPPDTTEQDLKALFDDSPCIETVTLIREGSYDRLLALVDMDIGMSVAEATQHRFHRRWWHGRLLNVSLMLH